MSKRAKKDKWVRGSPSDSKYLKEILPSAVPAARQILKSRIFGLNGPEMEILDAEFTSQRGQLVEVLKKCVGFGESNSAILMGPRGAGKSVLLQSALTEIEEYNESYFYVYLNGLVQTDDRIALQEMARQLKLENVIGDKVHGSFADNLAFIFESLQQGSEKTKSIVLVLDEFDLFAQHKNQSLLYNLLDVAQFKQCPIAVIGITCRLDVLELLEKRVKSRYSHRCILAYSTSSFDDYLEIFRKVLTLPEEFKYSKYNVAWKKTIEDLLDNTSVQSELLQVFNRKKDIGELLHFLAYPVCRLTTEHWYIHPEDIIGAIKDTYIDTKSVMMKGLSVLELCLFIAMQHLYDQRDGDPFNFEMIYDELLKFGRRQTATTFHFEKAVALKAFEHLISIELVKPLDSMLHTSLPKEFKSMTLLVDRAQIQETIKAYPNCPTELQQWTQSMFA